MILNTKLHIFSEEGPQSDSRTRTSIDIASMLNKFQNLTVSHD